MNGHSVEGTTLELHICMKSLLQIVSILVISLVGLTSHSETLTSLELKGLSFISSDYDKQQPSNFAFLGATLQSNEKEPELFMVSASGYYAPGNSALSYLNVRELYFYLPTDETTKIYFGRKLWNWSSLDSDFNLGFFQPQFRWNPLQPENQGLFGYFWDRKTSDWGLTLFASYLFLPDQGASYEIKDGQFENTNPWFRPPPQNIKFQGAVLPIDYRIEKPDTAKVIFRPLLAAQFRYGHSKGLYSQFSGAYKPAHQLALGYSGVLVTTRVKIKVVPQVYNEILLASDLGYFTDWGGVQLSVLHTKPENPTFEDSANIPVFEESTTWGPRVTYDWSPFQLSLAFFDTFGGQVSEVGPDTNPDRNSLSQRFLYRQAFQAQVKYSEIFLKKVKIESQLQYIHSELDQFSQVNLRNKINLKGPWAFWADVILIETADEAMQNMNSFRNLDQVWIGASYDI